MDEGRRQLLARPRFTLEQDRRVGLGRRQQPVQGHPVGGGVSHHVHFGGRPIVPLGVVTYRVPLDQYADIGPAALGADRVRPSPQQVRPALGILVAAGRGLRHMARKGLTEGTVVAVRSART